MRSLNVVFGLALAVATVLIGVMAYNGRLDLPTAGSIMTLLCIPTFYSMHRTHMDRKEVFTVEPKLKIWDDSIPVLGVVVRNKGIPKIGQVKVVCRFKEDGKDCECELEKSYTKGGEDSIDHKASKSYFDQSHETDGDGNVIRLEARLMKAPPKSISIVATTDMGTKVKVGGKEVLEVIRKAQEDNYGIKRA